ncbi:MAG: hypothetical protein ABSG51_03485 [Terracidiphilus sp.]
MSAGIVAAKDSAARCAGVTWISEAASSIKLRPLLSFGTFVGGLNWMVTTGGRVTGYRPTLVL